MTSPAASAPLHMDAASRSDMAGIVAGQSSFNLRYVTAAIRANSKMILVVILGAMAIGFAVTLLQTPRYTASTSIQINDNSARVVNDDEARDQQVNATGDTDRFLKTQTEVIKSRGIALRVVQKLNLVGDPGFYAAEELAQPAPGTPIERVREKAANALVKHLTVDLPRDSRIVTIQYETTNAALAARIANAYASEFIDSNLQRKFDSSAYARDFLAKQLDVAKQRVQDSERAVNDYTRSQGLIITRAPDSGDSKQSSGSGGGTVTTSSLLQLNSAANEATARRITAESRWAAVSGSGLMNSTEVLGNAAVSQLITHKGEVEAELSQERARHLEDYPTVVAKRAELNSINVQLRNAALAVRDAVKAEYNAAKSAEDQLKRQVTELKSETLSEQDRTVQYSLLSRDLESNRQVYDGLLERYKQLNATAGASLSNVSVIDVAVPPVLPSSPKAGQNLLLAAILGAGLAVILVYIKDQFDDSIRVPEDLENKLGLAMLGVIPKTSSLDPSEELDDPKSSVSEAYNSLRGALLYSTANGLPKVIMVTSAQPSEGKTTTSFAIATTLARMGKTVLLIDADLRRPSVHRKIDHDNDEGLATLLVSQNVMERVVRQTGEPNLSAITSGPIPPSPTELLASVQMEVILKQAAAAYDVVILDTPPVLGLADSPEIAPLADGVVFVVEADRSRHGSLKTALRRLRLMRPIMLGAVLTKFDALKAGKDYYDYYGYNYYQYVASDEQA